MIEEYEFNSYKNPTWIICIDNKEIVVSIEFPFGKQDFQYSIGYKDIKEIRPKNIFPEMSIYKKYSDKTKCMYFMIKGETFFDKYMTI